MILSVDIGTTNIKARVLDDNFKNIFSTQKSIKTYYPAPGWVEQNPEEVYGIIKELILKISLKYEIDGLGITNQRATTVVWDQKTSKPIYNAITWMDVRGSEVREKLKGELGELFREIEIFLNPNASSMYIRWILDNIGSARDLMGKGHLKFGNLNTYIIWKLTGGEVFATDPSNAVATGLFDPFGLEWAEFIFDSLKISVDIMPEVLENSDDYGETKDLDIKIPIYGSIGDQQSGLLGEGCIAEGDTKITHGTGSFIDMNTGNNLIFSQYGLLPLIAWRIGGKTTYMLEGYIRNTGDLIDWLIDIGILKGYEELDQAAQSLSDNGGVYLVPAFSGLGAPYWNDKARGLIIGLTRRCDRKHIIRAALESIAYLSHEILSVMSRDTGHVPSKIRIDGGLARSSFLCQYTSNLLQIPVERPYEIDVSLVGAAYLVGLKLGLISSVKEVKGYVGIERTFNPEISIDERDIFIKRWKNAVDRALDWCV